jgi:organic hydroperoxide reductase OsmC/OhrA
MHPYPHRYLVSASATAAGSVAVSAPQLPPLTTAPPPEFDGPGGVWSPETLLCAAVADCLILTFRALSRLAQLKWLRLECRVEGTLERVERVAQFTRFASVATLAVPEGTDLDKAHQLLEQAERSCLISNSLRGTRTLEAQVVVETP